MNWYWFVISLFSIFVTVQWWEEVETQAQLQQCGSVRGWVGGHWGQCECPHTVQTLPVSIPTVLRLRQIVMYPALSVQLRTSMVKGETGTLTLDVRAAVDKGVSVFASANLYVKNIKLLEVLLFVRFILLIPKHTGRFSAVPGERLTSWNNRGDFCDGGPVSYSERGSKTAVVMVLRPKITYDTAWSSHSVFAATIHIYWPTNKNAT